jgi:hypothetical protein
MGCLAVAPNGTLGALWIQHEKYETNPQGEQDCRAATPGRRSPPEADYPL